MSKKDFYVSLAAFCFIGANYIAAMVYSIVEKNYTALCGYFCAACFLAIAFTWYCDNRRLRSLLPTFKKKKYCIVIRGQTSDGYSLANVYITASKITEAAFDAAIAELIRKEKEDGITFIVKPVILNVIEVDDL